MKEQFNLLSPTAKPLKVHEWLAIVVLVGIVTGIALASSLRYNQTKNQLVNLPATDRKDYVEVFINGCVEYPGAYHIPANMLLKDFLRIAGVLPNADLRRYNLERNIRSGRLIKVKLRAMINIQIKGAVVNSRALSVPKGTSMEDLLHLISFEDNADTSGFHKKRKLKDNEIIHVPTLSQHR